MRVLREKLDETNVRLTRCRRTSKGCAMRCRRRRRRRPRRPARRRPNPRRGQHARAGLAAPPRPTGLPAAPAGTAATGMTPRRLYETAYADYTAGQWSLAVQGFETYLKTFPKSELADDAQYYIGESYAGDSKFRDAAAAYERVIRDYPQSDILPEA